MVVPHFANWSEWNRYWQKTITDSGSHGYEWNFAQKVLKTVPGLSPNEVTPQREFVSNEGRTLHMDFSIERDSIRIAIEIEGWDKTGKNQGKTKAEHDDFNRRLQSLTADGWRNLTITNAQFMGDPALYANQIRQMLLQAEPTKVVGPVSTEPKEPLAPQPTQVSQDRSQPSK